MIVKLHGTSGSGKTTVARELMKASVANPTPLPNLGRRPSGYMCLIPGVARPLFILGPYETTCGGLDALGNADDHIELLLKYGPQGHVFYEGLLQSGFYGRIGAASEIFGDDHVFAFLDTPIELCIKRVGDRRIARGNLKPLDPANTEDKYDAIKKLYVKLQGGRGIPKRPTVMIDHTKASEQLLEMYREADDREAA